MIMNVAVNNNNRKNDNNREDVKIFYDSFRGYFFIQHWILFIFVILLNFDVFSSNQNNNNNNNVNEGIDVLLNEFENNVNIMGTGVPMMGRKLTHDSETRNTVPQFQLPDSLFDLYFDELKIEILKYIRNIYLEWIVLSCTYILQCVNINSVI